MQMDGKSMWAMFFNFIVICGPLLTELQFININ